MKKLLLLLLAIVFLGAGCGQTDENGNKLIDCVGSFDGGTWFAGKITQEKCDEIVEGRKDFQEKKKQKAKDIGCVIGVSDWQCVNGFKDYRYENNEAGELTWIETEESKMCSEHAEKTVSELPIKCLDYFGIKK